MKTRQVLHYLTSRKCRLLTGVLFVFSCLVFVPSSYADTAYFNGSYVYLTYKFVGWNSDDTRAVSSNYSTYLDRPTVYDSSTGIAQYQFSAIAQNGSSWCATRSECHLQITNIEIRPRNYDGSNYVYNTDLNDYIHVKAWSLNDWYLGYSNLVGGTSYYRWNMFSPDFKVPVDASGAKGLCRDNQDVCYMSAWSDRTIDGFTGEFDGFSFTAANNYNSTLSYYIFRLMSFPYNNNTHRFEVNSTQEYSNIFFTPYFGDVVWYFQIWSDQDFIPPEEEDEGLSEFNQEKDYIEGNVDTAYDTATGLVFGVQVPWVFSGWFSLFTNSDCANIPTIASWLHSNETTICTPWPSEVRSALTPFFGIMSTLLVFGFVIRWLIGLDHDESTEYVGKRGR